MMIRYFIEGGISILEFKMALAESSICIDVENGPGYFYPVLRLRCGDVQMTARTNVHGDVAGLRLVTTDRDATQRLVDDISELIDLEISKEDCNWGSALPWAQKFIASVAG